MKTLNTIEKKVEYFNSLTVGDKFIEEIKQDDGSTQVDFFQLVDKDADTFTVVGFNKEINTDENGKNIEVPVWDNCIKDENGEADLITLPVRVIQVIENFRKI